MCSNLRNLSFDVAKIILETLPQSEGDVLVFLPRAEEIERCFDLLEKSLPENIVLCKLHGTLSFEEQKEGLIPAPTRQNTLPIRN